MKSIRGFTQNRLWHHVTNEDHVDSIIQFENGAIAQLTISSIARLKKPHVRILGTNGAVIQNAIGEELIVKPEQARRVIAVLDTTCKSAEEGKELPVPYEYET